MSSVTRHPVAEDPGTTTGWDRRTHAFMVLGLTALAALLTLLNETGAYIADFRFEVAWNPEKTLRRIGEARDIEAGLGRNAASDRSLLPALLFGGIRALGMPAWVAQRLWHTALFALAGSGMIPLLRWRRPALGPEHLLAGAAYMLSPVALGLLVPSPIFAVHAAAPWMVAAVVWGLTGHQPFRWAGVLALATLLIAPSEVPGLAYNLLWCGLAAVFVLAQDRRRLSIDSAKWLVAGGVLTVASVAYALFRTVQASSDLLLRIGITEDVDSPALASSFSEVTRGLGHWLTYLNISGSVRPQLAAYLESPQVILATFLVVGVAVITGIVWRRGAFFAALIPLSALITVGLYPRDDLTPWGRFITWLYDTVPASTGLRATSKASPGVAMGVSALFAVGVALALVGARERWTPRRWPGRFLAAAALATVVMASQPAWTGSLYNPERTVTEVPDYWFDAMATLDSLGPEETVLVLPGTSNTRYTWGAAGDDIFAGLTDSRWVVGNGFATTAPVTNELLVAVTRASNERSSLYSTLVPTLQRLGIDYVLIRNDLEWEQLQVGRPASFQWIRSSPHVERVGVFGSPGQNMAQPSALSGTTEQQRALERNLRPVELYAVGDFPTDERALAVPFVVLAGSGDGIVNLDQSRLVTAATPVRYAEQIDGADLPEVLRRGPLVVMTDTNTRSTQRAVGSVLKNGAPLSDAAENDDTVALFDTPGAITTPVNAEGAEISETNPTIAGSRRPEQAFDGRAQSLWSLPWLADPDVNSILVEWPEPVAISAVDVLTAHSENIDIELVRVAVNGGERRWYDVDDGDTASIDLGEPAVTALEFGFTVDTTQLATYGIAEITIDGQDLRTGLELPSRLIDHAATDPAAAAALANTPSAYLFERLASPTNPATETTLRREFTVDTARTFRLEGAATTFGEEFPDDCRGLLFVNDEPIAIRTVGTPDPFFGLARVESCEPIELGPGRHRFTHQDVIVPERIALVDVTAPRVDALVEGVTDASVAGEWPPGAVELVESTAPTVRARVSNATPGQIVTSGQAWQSGWSATVDGSTVPVIAADTFAAVEVPGGDHDVVFRFDPQSRYRWALLATILGVTLSLICVIGSAVRASSRRVTSAAAADAPHGPHQQTPPSDAHPQTSAGDDAAPLGADTHQPVPATLAYNPALDGLRAIAVVLVLVYHGDLGIVESGFFGVDLFMVLSGYLISTLLLREHDTRGGIRLGRFWLRRARRLLPALLAMVAFTIVYGFWLTDDFDAAGLGTDVASVVLYVSNWRFAFEDLSYFDAVATPSPLLHTWSLGIEEQWYVVFPIVAALALRWRRGSWRGWWFVVGALAAASAVWFVRVATGVDGLGRAYYGTDTRAQAFLAGTLLALLLHRRVARGQPPDDEAGPEPAARRWVAAAGWLGMVVVIAISVITDDTDSWLYRGGFAVIAAAGAAAVFGAAEAGPGALRRLLSWAPMVGVGRLSYSLYLWHWPLFILLDRQRTGLDGWALFVVRVLVSFAVAAVSYRLLEQPIRFSPRVTARRLAVSVTAVSAVLLLAASGLPSARTVGSAAPLSTGGADNPEYMSVVAGDSMWFEMISGVGTTRTTMPTRLRSATRIGCGLMESVDQRENCIDLRAEWARMIADLDPDIVLAGMSVWDLVDMVHPVTGETLTFGSAAFARYAFTEFDRVAAILGSTGAPVWFSTLPCYEASKILRADPADRERRVIWLNRVLAAFVDGSSRDVALVDLRERTCENEDGAALATIDGVELYRDGGHFNPAPGAWLLDDLLNEIAEAEGIR